MLNYLIENHIHFFEYLYPREINNLVNITRNFNEHFPNHIWKDNLTFHGDFKDIKLYAGTINLVHNINYIVSIDTKIIPKNMHPYQYLSLKMCRNKLKYKYV